MKKIAAKMASPPIWFIHKAVKAFFTETSSFLNEIKRKEASVVSSKNRKKYSRLSDETTRFIAPINQNIIDRKYFLRNALQSSSSMYLREKMQMILLITLIKRNMKRLSLSTMNCTVFSVPGFF